MCVCVCVCLEVMEVVKGHRASFPLLPKEGLLLCDRLLVSCWPNENAQLHHGLGFFSHQNTATSESAGECSHTHRHQKASKTVETIMKGGVFLFFRMKAGNINTPVCHLVLCSAYFCFSFQRTSFWIM